ncbi:MAG: prepilin-type N-terminal cleavage/methylation domain-containing protein [Patescibacteria group bacterium]
MRNRTNKNGFTLIEVLVVATIISLLASIGFVSYASFSRQSRDARRKTDLENVRSALELYRSDNDYYPVNLLTIAPTYILTTPADPQSSERLYSYSPTGSPVTSYSMCAGLEGNTSSKTGCGDCGTGITCSYKLTPLGVE